MTLFPCRTCKLAKPVDQLLAGALKHGSYWCIPCARQYGKAWKRRNARKIAIENKLRKYNITLDELIALNDLQGGLCAICRRPETRKPEKDTLVSSLSVDHDHDTGIVRGLLCNRCNRALGMFRESPELLEIAASYLRNGGTSSNGKFFE